MCKYKFIKICIEKNYNVIIGKHCSSHLTIYTYSGVASFGNFCCSRQKKYL